MDNPLSPSCRLGSRRRVLRFFAGWVVGRGAPFFLGFPRGASRAREGSDLLAEFENKRRVAAENGGRSGESFLPWVACGAAFRLALRASPKKSRFPLLTPLARAAALAAGLLAFGSTASAQLYWDNNGSTTGFGTATGTWAAPTTNDATQGWSSSSTGATLPTGTTTTATTDALNFGTSANQLGTGTITVSGNVSANMITLVGSSSNITLSGGNITLGTSSAITVTNSANTSAITETISSNITLGATPTWTVNNGGTVGTATLNVSGNVRGGANGLTKAGNGTLTLSGAANSWNGTTNVSVGTLTLSGSLTSNANVFVGSASGGVLNVTGNLTQTKAASPRNFQITNGSGQTGTVNVSGSGIINSTGLFLGDNGGGNATLNISGGTFTNSGETWLAGSNNIVSVSGGTFTANNFEFGAGIANGISTVTVNGTGAMNLASIIWARQTSSNTTLNLGTGSAGGNLSISGISWLGGSNTINFNGGTLTTSGAITISSANAATVVKSGGAVFNVASNTLTISGNLTTDGTGGGLTKNGTGTLTLSGTNTYTGGTTVNAGTLSLATAAANGTIRGNLTINQGATVNASAANWSMGYGGNRSGAQYAGNSVSTININRGTLNFTDSSDSAGLTASSIVLTGGTIASTGTFGVYSSYSLNPTIQSLASANRTTISSGIGLRLMYGGTGSLTFDVANGTTSDGIDMYVSGGIVNSTSGGDGGGNIVKSGSGTLLLAGNNTYTGTTTINAGTLRIGAGGATGALSASSAITNNGTLSFNRTDTVTQGTQFASTIGGTGNLTQAGTGTLILSGNNTYTGSTSLNNGTIQIGHANGFGTTGNITFGGGTLQYGSGISQDLSARIKNSASAILIDTNGQNVTFASAVDSTNSGGLTKNGTGNLTLSGANSYTGNTTVNAGTLALGANQNLGAIAGAGAINLSTFTLTTNSSSSTTFSGNISGTGGLTKAGSSTLTLSGNNTYSGLTTINTGTLALGGSGSSTIAGNITIAGGELNYSNASDNQIADAANITMSSGALTMGARAETINSLALSGGNLTIGSGTLSLSAASSFTGGNVSMTSVSSRLNSTGTTTLGNTTFSYNNASDATSGIILAGDFLVNASSTANFTNAAAGAGRINLGSANRVFDVGTGSAMNVGWYLDSTNASGALTKNGAGSLTLSGNNTYTGATTINAGTLQVSGSGLLGSGAYSGAITNNGTFLYNGTNSQTLSGVISGTGALTKNNTSTLTLSGNNTYTGATTVNAGTLQIGAGGASGSVSASNAITNNGTIVFNRTDTVTQGTDFANSITGSGNITQSGSGTLVLGTNTYTGATTVNSGTLQLAGNITSSALTVGTGGIISIGNTTAAAKASASSITLQGGSGYAFTIGNVNSSVAGTDYDQLATTGALTLSNTAANPFTIYISGTPTGWSNTGTYSWDLISAASLTGFNSGNFTWNLENFGIAGGNRTGTWDISNPSGGIIRLSYAAATPNYYWSGSSGNWTTGFTPSQPITDKNLFFIGAVGGTATNNISNSTLSSLNFITFNSTAGSYTLAAAAGSAGASGGTALTVKGDITNYSSNAQTINMDLALVASSTGIFNTAAGNITIGGVVSGAGVLTKQGNRTLILSANNTYSGATLISGGTLQIGVGGTSGALNANSTITNNGMLVFNRSNTVTQGTDFANVISGTGNLTHAGSGNLILNGNNTYTGTTTISAGTLEVGSAGRLGGGNYSGNIANSGVLIYSGSNAQTLSGVISGTGALTHNNTSTLTLSGNNTYTGTTTISAGTLLISSAGRLGGGSYSGNIANSGTFLYNGTNSQTLSGILSGTGALTKNNSSTLTLTGSNTYNGAITINAGTLEVGGSGALGGGAYSGNYTLNGVNSTLSFNSTTAQTLSGTKSGNGSIVKNGSGNLTISGAASSFSGVTTVNSGTLNLAGGLSGGSLVINSGATAFATGGHNPDTGITSITINGGTYLNNDANWYINAFNGALIMNSGTVNGGVSGRGFNPGSYTLSGNNTINHIALGGGTFNVTNGTTTIWNNPSVSNNSITTITSAITKNGSGTLSLIGNSTYSGTTTLNNGTLGIGAPAALGTSTLTIVSGTLDNLSGAAITLTNNNTQNWNGDFAFAGTNNLNLGTGNVTMNASRTVTVNSGTLSVYGNITGSGFGLTKNGSGTLTINSSSAFSGAKTVNGGTLRLESALGAGGFIYGANSTININNGSTLQFGYMAGTGSNPIFQGLLMNIDSNGGATIVNDGLNALIQGSAVTINSTGGAQNLLTRANTGGTTGYWNSQGGNGAILFNVASGTNATADMRVTGFGSFGDGYALTKNGTGKLLLETNNTFHGFNLNNGSVEFGGTGNFTTSAVSASFVNNGTFTFNSTGTGAISTNITGTGAITQRAGTLTINGSANTYNGATTVSGGTLALGSNITSSALTLNSGGVISVGTNSTLATINKVNTASITINGGSGYAVTIGNVGTSVAGTDYDQLTATGALTLNNTAANPFTIYLNGTPTSWSNSGNYSWTIISAASQTGFSPGNFALDFSNFGIAGSSRTGTWSFTSPSGGNVILSYAAVTDAIWSGGGGNWNAGFSPSVATDMNLVFTGAGGTATNNINDSTFSSVNFITFNSTAGAYTLAANANSAGAATPLTVKGDIINNSSNATGQTIGMNLALLPTSTGIVNTASGNITLSGNISGVGGITKSGTSSLTLSGANTYNGTTTINSGTVFVTSNTALGSTAAGTTLNGGRLILNGNGLNISENITVNSFPGTGVIQSWNGNNTISGLITLNAYHDVRGNGVGTLTLAGGVTSSSNQSLTFSTPTVINTNPITLGSGATLTFSGFSNQLNVAGNTFGILTPNYGATLTMGASNALANATVQFGSLASLANGNGTLSLNGTNQTVAGITIDSGGNVDNQAHIITGGGVLTVNQTSNATRSYGGRITDGATATSLVKNGNGTLMLQNWSGVNSTYSGATTINAGTLMILAGNGTSLSSNSAYTVASGAVLTLGGNSTVAGPATANIGSLAGAGTVQNGNATTAITLTTGLNNSNSTFSGVLQNGAAAALALTKNGTGTFTLSGNNTYTGATTVNAGTLGLDGRLSGNTAITIAGSGALTQSATGVISGTSSLTHNSTGTSTLGGNNTYSGGTTVNAGTLTLTGSSTGGGAVMVDGGTMNIQGNLTLGSGQFTVGNTTTGVVNQSAGTVSITSGNGLIVGAGSTTSSNGTYNLSGGVLNITPGANRGISLGWGSNSRGNFNMSGGTLVNTGTLQIGQTTDADTMSQLPVYSQTGGDATHGSLTMGGSGAWRVHTTTTTLSITGGNFTAGNFTVLSGGTNNVANITIGGNAIVTLPAFPTTRGSGATAYLTFDGGTLRPTANSTAYLGGLTSANIRSGGITFDTNGYNITISQALLTNATSTGGGITKNGTGTLTLTGNNTFTGTTTINTGTLLVDAGGLLGGGSYSGNLAINGANSTFLYNGTTNQTLSGVITGNGALTKNNTATLTLSGNNNYSGTTTINAGTLAIGANMTMGSFTGTGNLSIGNGFTLTTNTSTSNTFSGLVIGSGALTKNGTATLTLGGNNTYSGATTINVGTLEIGAAGRLGGGSYSGNIATGSSSAVLLNSGTNNQLLSGIISGSGGVAQNAASTLTLTGNNTYTGATTIYDGTIEIGAAGRLGGGTYAGEIDNSGVLIYSGTNNQTLSGIISSVGALTHNASSTLTLGGNNTYTGTTTINTGTFQISTTGLLGAGNHTGNIVNNGAFVFGSNFDQILSGNLSGTGSLTKSGSGVLTLTGTSSFNGATTISAGTLVVNGSAANSAVTIGNTGVLGGNGTVGALTVQSGGRVAPGNSPGNLNASTLTLEGGGGYNWEITNVSGTAGTHWDLITVGGGTGAATINAAATNNSTKFTIYISGNPVGWDTNAAYDWNIIDWGTVTGFDANAFAVDTTGFTGTAPIGSWVFSNTGGYLNLAYSASDPTWNGASGNWSTAFSPTLTTGNKSITFAGAAGGTSTNDIASGTVGSVAGITFNSTAGAYTLAANSGSAGYDTASALQLNGNIVNNSTATQTINLALTSTATRVYDAAAGNLTIGGVISGTGGLTKNGTGTLTLSGSNNYSGGTTLNAGTLVIASTGQISHSGSGFYVGGAGENSTVNINGGFISNFDGYIGFGNGSTGTVNMDSGNWTNGENLRVGYYGNGTLNLTGGNISNVNGVIGRYGTSNGVANVSGGTWSSSGTMTIGYSATGTLNLTGGNVVVGSGSGNITIARENGSTGTLNLGTGSTVGTLQAARVTGGNGTAVVNFNHTGDYTFAPILAGSLSVNKLGNGTTILSANNTYTGATTINAGTLQITSTGLLGGGNYSGNITNNGALVFGSNSNQTLGGVISGTGALTKNGSGTLTLTGSNNYSGGTTLNAGTLVIGNTAAAGSGSINQTSSGSLLKVDVTGTINNAMSYYTMQASRNATLAGAQTVNNASFNVDDNTTLTITGAISGNGGVTKNGNGTLTLNGTNTYNGSTIVNSGTLEAKSAGALGSNNTVQVNGGTLLVSANSSINGMNITLNGTSTTVPTLSFNSDYNGTIGTLTLSANSIIDMGNYNIGADFADLVMGLTNQEYTLKIYNWTGTTLWGGGNGVDDDDRLYFGGASDSELGRISFYSDFGNSFLGTGFDLGLSNQIIPVPEPETWATGILLVLGGAVWLWRKRRILTTEFTTEKAGPLR